ncbi:MULTISPECIES: hypothetical protein [Stutzerimonas]|uniref:Uncharacterized protein n=1 Tax=Stutzerimonas xanthomarina TaxID=271420 RepID=A0A3R8U134_9GAMM|nr:MULTISPECIES: hypothetical protein [Stutzerimonas]MBT1119298.1 hypothetical protein [Stutzerimonas nitrititolerans]MDH0084689.1 hypothetical protein [Stutzerimonas stutzeri]RRV04340.1 hypothetical protein EGJ28_22465 [Stutzerimonas xanthomarina]
MLWLFRKKSPTQKALSRLQRQCRTAQTSDLIGAGLVIDVLHSSFLKEFGSISDFCNRSRSEQDGYMSRLAKLQGHGKTKLGADLMGLWVIAAQIDDVDTQCKAAEVMALLSRQANGVKP